MNVNDITIDRASGIPITEQISNQILTAILAGELDPGDRLPTERELSEGLGVSRGTIKRAWARLAQSEAIDIRQGSGCYVLRNGHVLEQNQKKEAADMIAATFARLRGLGLSDKEILNLASLHCLGASGAESLRKVNIMVVSNNHDILSELEQQLSYLTDSSPFLFTLSFLTLEVIQRSSDPVQMLLNYDMIIATAIDYPAVVELAPMLGARTVEAEISPRTRTLVRLSALPSDAQISVVYRTERFCKMVLGCLESLGFAREQVTCYHERDYNPADLGENGVNVVINHNQSPVYGSDFNERREAFVAGGGHILRFEYQLERGSLVHIEDCLQRLLQQMPD